MRGRPFPETTTTWGQRTLVGFDTCCTALGVVAIVVGLGDGDSLSAFAAVWLVAACVTAIWLWRAGPGHQTPLVLSSAVCAVGVAHVAGPGLIRFALLLTVGWILCAGWVALMRWSDERRRLSR